MTTAITLDESKRLIALEGVIQKGLSNFIEVGNALAEIKEAKLYRADGKTFEEYCQAKWGFSRQWAHQLIGAAEATENLSSTLDAPTNARQAAPLAKLDTPEQQQEAWSAAVEKSGGQPTAKQVEAAVEEVKARAVETEVIPPAEKAPKYQPSDGLMYGDNAISQLAKIKSNDTQRTRAFAKVTKWIAEHSK